MIGTETYRELLDQLGQAKPGKECRILHRKLRKYGTGLCFRDRYPYADLTASIVALAAAVAALVMKAGS